MPTELNKDGGFIITDDGDKLKIKLAEFLSQIYNEQSNKVSEVMSQLSSALKSDCADEGYFVHSRRSGDRWKWYPVEEGASQGYCTVSVRDLIQRTEMVLFYLNEKSWVDFEDFVECVKKHFNR